MTTKLDNIVGNPRIFKIILDDFFRDWPGSFDIMPAEDAGVRTFKEYDKFAKFCKKVRSKDEGYRRCMACDIEYAEKAKLAGRPLYYTCHAGLIDIAVPIIIDGELIATIFCGQSQSWDEEIESAAIQRTVEIERELGFREGELLALRQKTPVISKEQIETVKNRLWEIATYVSELGSSKLQAVKAKNELDNRLRESEAIQNVLLELSEIATDLDSFWRKLDFVLEKICSIIGAASGVFVTCQQINSITENMGIVRATTLKSKSLKKRNYYTCDKQIATALATMTPIITNISVSQISNSLFNDILQTVDNFIKNNKIAIVPVKLSPDLDGAMIFFISSQLDEATGLNIESEVTILTQAGTRITAAYGNCLTYKKQKELAEIQSDWLENVSHQILAPINGILGGTENLARSYKNWQKNNPQRIDNTLVTLIELSNWATRMASNFAWVAKDHNYSKDLKFRLEDDLPGKLIGYARNVQGLARTRGISRVHVDKDSVGMLNGRIKLENKLFKQAMTNLLDNAVKYANPRTEVIMSASLTTNLGCIHITNFGIQIKEEETERIFDRYFRTEAAKRRSIIGTGIGLGIARDIMHLHGGEITASASINTVAGWKTTLTISLPLLEEVTKNG